MKVLVGVLAMCLVGWLVGTTGRYYVLAEQLSLLPPTCAEAYYNLQ